MCKKNEKPDKKAKEYFTREDAYKALDTITMWIGNCDTKASIFLGSIGVVFTVILSSDYVKIIKNILENTFSNFKGLLALYGVFVIICSIACIVGIIFLVATITPKIISKPILKKKKKNENNSKQPELGEIMFFGKIAKLQLPTYLNIVKQNMDKQTSDVLLEELVFQIHSCAKICNSKFLKFKIGIICFSIGFAFLCLLLIIGYYTIHT